MRGFEYLVYSALSLSLLVVLIALPVAPAFASVEGGLEESPAESAPESIAEPEAENDGTEAVSEPASEETSEAIEEEITEEAVTTVSSEETILNTEEAPPDDAGADGSAEGVSAEDEDVAEDTADVPSEETGTSTEEVIVEDSASTTTEETPQEIVPEEEIVLPPTEEPLEEEVPIEPEETVPEDASVTVVSAVTNDENRFTFSKDECTTTGEGSFYCTKADPDAEVLHTDRIFAAADSNGDKEIYIEKGSELTQITSNAYDDDAPYFDEVSNTIVWHRLMDGRYQIMAYDINSAEEIQITNDRYNNMQPNRFGDSLVWQGWVGSDWEIFLLEDESLTMLTDNTTHDVTPTVNGTHIVWQSFEGNAWHMKVYDLRTKQIETIQAADGGSIENLRFVLMYDTKSEEGDVSTRGYDLKTGNVIELGSRGAAVPEELPDPEQTGEERALVTPPVQPKTKIDGELDEDPEEPVIPDVTEDEAESTPGDVIIPPFEEASSTPESTEIIEETADTTDDEDVIIPPYADTEVRPVDHIDDVIVTPFVEPISEVNAQDPIVSGS